MTERRRASLVRSCRAARLRSVRSWTWRRSRGAALGADEELAQGLVDAQEPAVQADQWHPDGGLVEAEAEVHPAPLALTRSDE
jgi:hypothetical protein